MKNLHNREGKQLWKTGVKTKVKICLKHWQVQLKPSTRIRLMRLNNLYELILYEYLIPTLWLVTNAYLKLVKSLKKI